MKKKTVTALALALSLGLLAGCGADEPPLTASDYILDPETCETSRGITLGATPEAFFDAYEDCSFFTSTGGSDYRLLSEDEIPFDSAVTILVPTFFVDREPIVPAAFCKENDISEADLIAYLSAADYLSAHTVEYRYLTFLWEDGVVADIQSVYMNYNEEGAN